MFLKMNPGHHHSWLAVVPLCLSPSAGLLSGDLAVWRNHNVPRDVFKARKGHCQLRWHAVDWTDKTKKKNPPSSTCKDLKALYLQNVLRGDTSRANKFRVHVEAYGSVWCLWNLNVGPRAWDIIRPSAWGSPTPTAHGFLGSIHHGWCLRAAGAHANAKAFGPLPALSDCQANSKFWISKQEYQECGAGPIPTRDLPNHVFAWDELVSTLTTLNVTIWHRQ